MTYGNYPPGGPVGVPGPAGPPYPYGPAPADPYYPYGGYGPPPGPGGYPPPPLPYPPDKTNPLATWAIVFAFVFAPLGALLGHLALGQIRRTHERGRDRALIGLTLSYAFIVLAVVGLTASLVLANRADEQVPSVALPSIQVPAPKTPAAAAPDLSGVLLSLDEVKTIMKTPGLVETESTGGGSAGTGGKQPEATPAECLGAVAPGIDTVYQSSGAIGYKRASFSDPTTATMVEQVAVSFDSPAEARRFVAQSRDQWQQCAGKTFSITGSSGSLTWDIGTLSASATRLNLDNTITVGPGVPQYRVLAVQGSVVVDISVVSRDATDEADVIADRILARVPS